MIGLDPGTGAPAEKRISGKDKTTRKRRCGLCMKREMYDEDPNHLFAGVGGGREMCEYFDLECERLAPIST